MAISNPCRPIYFDLETTGLGTGAEIVQIGAFDPQSNYSFSRYILPKKDIPYETTMHNGFEIINNELYQHGAYRSTSGLKSGLIQFLEYLEDFNEPITLVGHNIFNFDCRFLFKGVKSCNLINQFSSVVQDFSDSLPIFRKYLSHLASKKLGYIYRKIVGSDFLEHDALQDSIALSKIFDYAQLEDNIWEFSESFDDMLQRDTARIAANQRFQTMAELMNHGVSRSMVLRMAEAGISMGKISNIWYNEGEEGLEMFLSEIMENGRPRVTSHPYSLSIICEAVENILY